MIEITPAMMATVHAACWKAVLAISRLGSDIIGVINSFVVPVAAAHIEITADFISSILNIIACVFLMNFGV